MRYLLISQDVNSLKLHAYFIWPLRAPLQGRTREATFQREPRIAPGWTERSGLQFESL